jgi:hypothetical protein
MLNIYFFLYYIMPKRYRHKSRTMKGGFLDDISNTLSEWGTSISQGASNIWQKTKSSLTGSTSYQPTTTYQPTPPPIQTQSIQQPTQVAPPPLAAPMNTSTYGGKYSRRKRHKKGGGIATNSSPITGIKTAQPHNLVGGKTKKCKKSKCKTLKKYKH